MEHWRHIYPNPNPVPTKLSLSPNSSLKPLIPSPPLTPSCTSNSNIIKMCHNKPITIPFVLLNCWCHYYLCQFCFAIFTCANLCLCHSHQTPFIQIFKLWPHSLLHMCPACKDIIILCVIIQPMLHLHIARVIENFLQCSVMIYTTL